LPFGLIHSKLRNCLSEEPVEKLVFIKTNYNALCGDSGSDALAHDCEESSASDDDQDAHDTISESNSRLK
jgi:hypothetical protein